MTFPVRCAARFVVALYCALGFLVPLSTALAQGQLDPLVVTPAGVPLLRLGSVDAADYDGDGDLDLIVTGEDQNGIPTTHLLRYDGRVVISFPNSGMRIEAQYAFVLQPIRSVSRGVARWVDFNGDGRPDLAITGMDVDLQDGSVSYVTELFANQNGVVFFQNRIQTLQGLFDSAMDWGDYDGDGDSDMVVAGNTGSEVVTLVYRNDGGGVFTDIGAPLEGVKQGTVRWGDYDGDGDLDLLVSGFSDDGLLTEIYRNDGGVFTAMDSGLPALLFSSADWADYDGDGDLDVVVIGGQLDPQIILGETHLYRNDGGVFTEVDVDLEGLFAGIVRWGDYDGDGDEDLFLMGQDRAVQEDGQWVVVYRNDGEGAFQGVTRFRGVVFGTGEWFDYNGDGRLDIMIMGMQEEKTTKAIFEL